MIGLLTVVFSSFAFLTNTFVVSVMLYHRKKLTVMLTFILNLLILDGIFALFGAAYRGPGIIDTQFYEKHGWAMTLCPMMPFFITWIPMQCSVAILLITIDRYIAIKRPLRYSSIMTRRVTGTLIGGLWLFQLLKFLVELLLDTFSDLLVVSYDTTLKRCDFNSKLYMWWVHLVYFGLPFLVMTFLHMGIFIEIWKHIRTRNSRNKEAGLKNRSQNLQKKVKMAVTLTLITFGFFVAWFPFVYSMTEGLFFKIRRPGFKVTIVMFYFNLLWDSVVYAMRTPAIYRLILHCFVGRRLVISNNTNNYTTDYTTNNINNYSESNM